VIPFFGRIVRGSQPKPGAPALLPYVLGLKWTVRTRAERDDFTAVEDDVRAAAIADLVLDKIEPGHNELSFWFETSNPKRAFKELSKVPSVAERMPMLQAAYAERSKLKFTVLWPKGGHALVPAPLK
jgi:hypothetical protein